MNTDRRQAARCIGAAATLVATAPLAGLTGCTLLRRQSPVPMDTVTDGSTCPATLAPALLVWLPGAFMTLPELQHEGFVAAVRRRRLAVDIVLVDSHLGHVRDGSVMRRLRDEVVGPARAQGYREIWLAGISLGGFLAMGYALEHPGEIAGIVAIAPYVGPPPLLQAIAAAGGPAAWRRSAGTTGGRGLGPESGRKAGHGTEGEARREAERDTGRDVERRLWMWLSAPPAGAPPLWLGYGTADRLAEGHRLLAGVLAPDRVDTAPGGHDWPPWRLLWDRWLDRGLLPGSCV